MKTTVPEADPTPAIMSDDRPPREEYLALVRALAKRAAREDHDREEALRKSRNANAMPKSKRRGRRIVSTLRAQLPES